MYIIKSFLISNKISGVVGISVSSVKHFLGVPRKIGINQSYYHKKGPIFICTIK